MRSYRPESRIPGALRQVSTLPYRESNGNVLLLYAAHMYLRWSTYKLHLYRYYTKCKREILIFLGENLTILFDCEEQRGLMEVVIATPIGTRKHILFYQIGGSTASSFFLSLSARRYIRRYIPISTTVSPAATKNTGLYEPIWS